MIEAHEFRARWLVGSAQDPDPPRLIRLPGDATVSPPLRETTRRFLVDAGLPEDAAPCMSFRQLGTGLLRAWDVWGPSGWSEAERQRVAHWILIGSDGAGNPVCIDQSREDRIVLPDHEDHFRTVMEMNTSVAQLAESVLAYRGAKTAAQLRDELARIDPECLSSGWFWSCEIEVFDELQEG